MIKTDKKLSLVFSLIAILSIAGFISCSNTTTTSSVAIEPVGGGCWFPPPEYYYYTNYYISTKEVENVEGFYLYIIDTQDGIVYGQNVYGELPPNWENYQPLQLNNNVEYGYTFEGVNPADKKTLQAGTIGFANFPEGVVELEFTKGVSHEYLNKKFYFEEFYPNNK